MNAENIRKCTEYLKKTDFSGAISFECYGTDESIGASVEFLRPLLYPAEKLANPAKRGKDISLFCTGSTSFTKTKRRVGQAGARFLQRTGVLNSTFRHAVWKRTNDKRDRLVRGAAARSTLATPTTAQQHFLALSVARKTVVRFAVTHGEIGEFSHERK